MTFANLANSISNIDVGIKSDSITVINQGTSSIYSGDMVVVYAKYNTAYGNNSTGYNISNILSTENFMIFFYISSGRVKCTTRTFNQGLKDVTNTLTGDDTGAADNTVYAYNGNYFSFTNNYSGNTYRYKINSDGTTSSVTSIPTESYTPTTIPLTPLDYEYPGNSTLNMIVKSSLDNELPSHIIMTGNYGSGSDKTVPTYRITNTSGQEYFYMGFEGEDGPAYVLQSVKINGVHRFLCGIDALPYNDINKIKMHYLSFFHYGIAQSYAAAGGTCSVKIIG